MLLYARVPGNYIPMKIHISETLWMRPKLLMDSKQTCHRQDINALYPLILKIKLCCLLTLGASLASIISPSIIEQTMYRGVSIWKSIFCCCCCWKDPSSAEINIRKVKHCPVTSESQSSQVWHQVGPWLKLSVENMSVSWIQMKFRYECCVIMKWWSFCEDWIIKNIFI